MFEPATTAARSPTGIHTYYVLSQRIYDPITGYGHCVMAVVGLVKNTKSASVRTFTSAPSWKTNNSTVPCRAPVTSTVVVSIGLFAPRVREVMVSAGPRDGAESRPASTSVTQNPRRQGEFIRAPDTPSWRQPGGPVTANPKIGDRCPDSARMEISSDPTAIVRDR